MSSDDDADWSLLEFAKKVAAIPKNVAEDIDRESSKPISETITVLAAPEEDINSGNGSLEIPLRSSKELAVESENLQIANNHSGDGHSISRAKQFRTPDDIASIIMKTLRTIDNCPDRGFVVTVYGSNPWNAMLTIRTDAGPRIDRELWCSRVREVGVQLRNEFDVADMPTVSTNGL